MAAPKKGTPEFLIKRQKEEATMLKKYGSAWAVHLHRSEAGRKGGMKSNYSHFQDDPSKASMAGQISSRSFNKLPLYERRSDYYVKQLLKEVNNGKPDSDADGTDDESCPEASCGNSEDLQSEEGTQETP